MSIHVRVWIDNEIKVFHLNHFPKTCIRASMWHLFLPLLYQYSLSITSFTHTCTHIHFLQHKAFPRLFTLTVTHFAVLRPRYQPFLSCALPQKIAFHRLIFFHWLHYQKQDIHTWYDQGLARQKSGQEAWFLHMISMKHVEEKWEIIIHAWISSFLTE